jgi:hypothetical protein
MEKKEKKVMDEEDNVNFENPMAVEPDDPARSDFATATSTTLVHPRVPVDPETLSSPAVTGSARSWQELLG